jgi:23S rRNA C2498 (ribose-2'-O)-methylase RlmM
MAEEKCKTCAGTGEIPQKSPGCICAYCSNGLDDCQIKTPCPDCQENLMLRLRAMANALRKVYKDQPTHGGELPKTLERAAERIEELLEACQGALIIINELTVIMDDFVAAKQLKPFPHPSLNGLRQAITNAGGVIFETAAEARAALGKEQDNG